MYLTWFDFVSCKICKNENGWKQWFSGSSPSQCDRNQCESDQNGADLATTIELPQTTPNYLNHTKPPLTKQNTQNRSIYTYIVYVYTYKIHILMHFGAHIGLFAHLYWCRFFLNLWLNLHNVSGIVLYIDNSMCSPCHISPRIKFYP